MPLYEYQCLKCARRTEKIEGVNGPHLKKCPHCGGKVEALISAPAIQFKGSGWYVTDYAGKSAAREAGNNADKAAEKKETESKESTAKGSDSKESSSKDTKETKEAKEKKAEKTEKTEKAAKKK